MMSPKLRAYLHVFWPTTFGVIVYSFLSLSVIVLHQFVVLRQVLAVPSQLHLGTLVVSTVSRWLDAVLGAGRTDTLVVGVFWGAVGLAVYVFLHGLAKVLREVGEDLEERTYIWPKNSDRNRPLENLARRLLFRLAVAGVMVVYVTHWLGNALRGPVLLDTGLAPWLTAHIWVEYAVWFVAEVLLWHGLVVLTRLLLLRERIL